MRPNTSDFLILTTAFGYNHISPTTALKSQPAPQDVNFCQGCRSLVSFVQVFNSSNRADYKDVVKSFCELYYPVSTDYQQGPCPLFVEVFYYVLQHTDPINHCDQIGACGPTTGDQYASEQPSDDIYEYFKNSVNQPKRSNNAICEFCEQIVTQAKETLSDPAAIDQARRQLEAVCDYLKVIDQDKECRQYLDKYIDQAIEFIRDIDPQEYCRSVQLCSADTSVAPRTSQPSKVANLPTLADFQDFGIQTSVSIGERPTAASNRKLLTLDATSHLAGPNCMICKAVVKELFQFLRNNKTEENIIVGLDRVCGLLYKPGPKRDECEFMVKGYTKELVQLLIEETNPEIICMLLEQCAYDYSAKPKLTSSVAAPADSSSPPTGSFGLGDLISALDPRVKAKSIEACIECKIFIKYLKDRLSDEKTQKELNDWLVKELCSELHDSELVDKCSKMVEKNVPIFFKALAGNLNSHTACAQLGVCPARRSVSVFRIDRKVLSSPASTLPLLPWPERRADMNAQISKKLANRPLEAKSPLCDECVETVVQIDDYISKHPVDQDVSTLIDKVCKQMPEGVAREKCIYIIQIFGDEIVQAISTMDNPRQLCSKFYLC